MGTTNIIRSHLHDINSETQNKVALTTNDDKRIIREDGIHTYAYVITRHPPVCKFKDRETF